jgi:hypothetical protein
VAIHHEGEPAEHTLFFNRVIAADQAAEAVRIAGWVLSVWLS